MSLMQELRAPVASCRKCGKQHIRNGLQTCAGHHRRTPDQPCMNWPMKGTHVCKMCGGKTPTTVAAAAKHKLAERANQDFEQLMSGRPLAKGIGGRGQTVRVVNPVQEVLHQLAKASFNCAWYEDLLQGRHLLQRAPDDQGVMWDKVDVVVDLYNAERLLAVRFAKIAHDMGIADLQIKATTEFVERIAAAFLAIANDAALALTSQQMEAFRMSAARELLRLTSEGTT